MTALRNLPDIFLVVAPVFFIGAFLLMQSSAGAVLGIGIYPFYATAPTVFAGLLFVLIRKNQDNMASVLQVCLFYEALFFALTLWAVSVIAFSAVFGADSEVLRSISRAFVASSAGIAWAGVGAIVYAWRRGFLWERIHPWPRVPWNGREKRVK